MIHIRIGTNSDIKDILALQEKYLYKNLNEAERIKGFVTTPFTSKQIEDIIGENGIFIAKKDNDLIIAYAFAGSWAYFEQWEIFKYMTSRFPYLTFQAKAINTNNSFQYGPVCIDEAFRGKRLLNLLFEEMRIEFLKKYPISITFINKVNAVSTKAHTEKLGWEIIDEFEFNNTNYIGLAFDMKISVLQ